MEARPWLRITLIFVGFLLLSWPLWAVTHSAAVVMPVREPTTAAAESLRVEVTFAQPPLAFDLEYLGQPLLSGEAPDRKSAVDWTVVIPSEGVELFVSASFPDGSPETAARVRVTNGETVVAEKTFWVTDQLAETLTVPSPEEAR